MVGLINALFGDGSVAQKEAEKKALDRNQEFNRAREHQKMLTDIMESSYYNIHSDGVPTGEIIAFPKPVSFTPVLSVLPDMVEYEEAAAVLGFDPPELKQHRHDVSFNELMSFMLDHGYPIYDNDAVHGYMSMLAANDGKFFVWKRLGQGEVWPYGKRTHGEFMTDPYQRAIPKNILSRAVSVKKAFGDKVAIYASDYAVEVPDPFICARIGNGKHIIFGMWDEPGFQAIGRDVK